MTLSTFPLERHTAHASTLTTRGLIFAISVLLFVPSMLFGLHLRPLAAAGVLGGCAAAMALIAATAPARAGRGAVLAERVDLRRLFTCGALALALMLLGGEGHVFYPTWDWVTRDAILADLVRDGFPLGYRDAGGNAILRAPLGMYMVPALVGRFLGLHAAHIVLLAQNTSILTGVLYLLRGLGRGWPNVAIVVFFAGVSIVGATMRLAAMPPADPPFWLAFGLDAWLKLFQYSGSLVQLFWVPNHALPGWWLAALLLLNARGEIDVATLGASVAGALFWSPLCVLPIIPWLAYQAARQPREVLLARRTWAGIAAGCGCAPIALYLLAGSATIASASPRDNPDFAVWYVLFIVLELPALGFLAATWRWVGPDDRAPLVFSAIVLLALPFAGFGPNNDLAMRASIPPLVIVAFVFGNVVLHMSARGKAGAVVGWAIVIAGLPSAIVETGRALMTPTTAISDCTLPDASRALDRPELPSNYVVPQQAVPSWLLDAPERFIMRDPARACSPDRLPPRFFWSTAL